MHYHKKNHMRTQKKIVIFKKKKGFLTLKEERNPTLVPWYCTSQHSEVGKIKFLLLKSSRCKAFGIVDQDTSYVTWPIIDHSTKTAASHAMADLINVYDLDLLLSCFLLTCAAGDTHKQTRSPRCFSQFLSESFPSSLLKVLLVLALSQKLVPCHSWIWILLFYSFAGLWLCNS